jgi:hypothetical protein
VPASGTLLAYRREQDGRSLGVILNLASSPARWSVPEELRVGRVLLTATGAPFEAELAGEVEIPADEGLLFEVAAR